MCKSVIHLSLIKFLDQLYLRKFSQANPTYCNLYAGGKNLPCSVLSVHMCVNITIITIESLSTTLR